MIYNILIVRSCALRMRSVRRSYLLCATWHSPTWSSPSWIITLHCKGMVALVEAAQGRMNFQRSWMNLVWTYIQLCDLAWWTMMKMAALRPIRDEERESGGCGRAATGQSKQEPLLFEHYGTPFMLQVIVWRNNNNLKHIWRCAWCIVMVSWSSLMIAVIASIFWW